MKKIKRASIISLTVVLAFMFITALAESAAAGRVLTPGIAISARHNYTDEDSPIIHLNKHDMTLQKGKSETLKVVLMPGGQSVTVTWRSSNPQIAKVSSSGKVTAVAPGIAIISASSERYISNEYSGSCYVTVPGGAKDAKPLGTSDQTFYYGKTKLKAPTSNYEEAIANVKKIIGGYAYTEEGGYVTGLLYGSKTASKAHTIIYITGLYEEYNGYGFSAKDKSPIMTSRGIAVGAKKSAILQQYGLPTYAPYYVMDEFGDGKIYQVYEYVAKTAGKDMGTRMYFNFLKNKDTVSEIIYFFGKYY